MVLRRLIRQSGVRRVRFSQYGIREGLLVEWLRSGQHLKSSDDSQFTLNLEEPFPIELDEAAPLVSEQTT